MSKTTFDVEAVRELARQRLSNPRGKRYRTATEAIKNVKVTKEDTNFLQCFLTVNSKNK
ncbi:hypothetical protein [Paenibacillus sp. CF384]|uniref:hypothetical protein n=1 Tax=Paenibacillus sp. CF384 TaxID=1884382 RepID=UPI000895785F|nr:hypothetical protein [Paenibacillus sp. CF384]SDW08136.1 hypothetical protein SAMN05518855_1001197 [Paenibacillus sp. CF384]